MRSKRAQSLLLREYIPFFLRLACIAAIGLQIGHADTVRLLAAIIIVRACRVLTSLDTTRIIVLRRGSSSDQRKADLSRAALVEGFSLMAEIIVLACAAMTIGAMGDRLSAGLILIAGLGAPADHLRFLGRSRRPRHMFRTMYPIALAALVAIASIYPGQSVMIFAGAFALSRWLALLAVIPGNAPLPQKTLRHPFHWTEAARRTAILGRRRFDYRIGRGILSAMLGPVGSLIARTGRGLKLHHRGNKSLIDRFGMNKIGWISMGGLMLALLAHMLITEPSSLLLLAAVMRIAATALSAWVWSGYAENIDEPVDQDDFD